MSTYKVPQDVEAEDKLLGPFTFRQFIYLIIAFMAGALAWGLYNLLPILVIIPLPIILVFAALALPLRKDQPMETYLAAMVSYFLKPRIRLWSPDRLDSLIEITVPRQEEKILTKNLSQEEAQERFSYLAQIADSKGWSIRGGQIQAPNSAMNSEVYFAAQTTQDMLDESNIMSQTFSQRLMASEAKHQQQIDNIMQGKFTPQPQSLSEKSYYSTPNPDTPNHLEFNPYPEIVQAVVQPLSEKNAVKTPESSSNEEVPAAIIGLANNSDLTVAAIAREAHRIQEKQDKSDEVFISLH